MTQRVQCSRCGAHRDLGLAPRCLVCGAEAWAFIEPSAGDMEAITREIVEAAEDLDVAHAHDFAVTCEHQAVLRLREACRRLSLARAGVLTYGILPAQPSATSPDPGVSAPACQTFERGIEGW